MPVVGVDEAGKGPVIGSMFAAALRSPRDALPDGLADSKTLSPARREELAAQIRDDDRIAVGVAEVSVERIDGDEDMNALTVAAHVDALSTVARDSDAVIVDAGDVDAARFGRRIARGVDADVDVTAKHRADESHPVVSAASIVAKVERDAHVERIAEEYGDVGSGYPSDPETREFLAAYVDEHGHLPACARGSWSTSADVLAAAEQSRLGEF